MNDQGGVRDIAVIGAGPAGCGAAVQCSRLGLDVVLLDRTGLPGGLVREARLLENYPGLAEPVSGQEYCRVLEGILLRNGLQVRHFEVKRLGLEEGLFVTEGPGGRIASRAVVMATGTEPVGFGLGPNGGELIYRSILPLREDPPSDAVIIGGGEAALDYALSLSDMGTRVTILVRGSGTKAGGRLLQAVLSRDSISIAYNTEPVRSDSDGQGTCLLTVRDDAGETVMRTQAVLAAVGRRAFLPGTDPGLDHVPGGVTTSVEGLFIAGDASLGSLGQASIAAGQGVLAAMRANVFLREGKGQ